MLLRASALVRNTLTRNGPTKSLMPNSRRLPSTPSVAASRNDAGPGFLRLSKSEEPFIEKITLGNGPTAFNTGSF
ncbi:MAG: hypothetical protein A3E98_00885 [Candidatus Doudnabacteria bacterium RIFCSPHIGHO2_12_FULL_48_11]|nr:MAG: hypothetical protein A3E98_00885 [Candidatus Doudnabacteria bacterium RIFCSPHIGHO2_12_FULL_48_11]